MSENQAVRQRDHLFDNIKAVMLFLVALGHVLDVYKGSDPVLMGLMKYVYLFHMPMFAFVTGYFTKNLERARRRAVSSALVPYLIVQTVYVAVAALMIWAGLASFKTDVFRPSVLLPSSAFYYLLAVFFWKLLGRDFLRLRFPLVLSVVMGVTFSLISNREFHEAYGAVFTLLCFFVAGVLCPKDLIEKIRRIPKWIGVIVLALGIVPALYLPYAIHSVRMTYESVGFTPLEGMGYRLIFYAVAALMCAAIINLMPEKKCFLSYIGVSSVVVYAASTFLSPHGYVLLEKVLRLPSNTWIQPGAMIVFCAVLVAVSGLPVFLKIFQWITGLVNKVLFRRDDGEEEISRS